MMRGMHRMAMRQMRVMGRLLMRSILMVLGGFAMMLRGMLVMLSGGMVVLGTFMLGHAALLLMRDIRGASLPSRDEGGLTGS